jgi:hypothetical protein
MLLNYSESQWELLQLGVPPGNLRMLWSPADSQYIVTIINDIAQALSDSERLAKQSAYFVKMEQSMESVATARSILQEHFGRLGVPKTEGQVLMDGSVSIKSIIQSSEKSMSEYCPIDMVNIRTICNSFQDAAQH